MKNSFHIIILSILSLFCSCQDDEYVVPPKPNKTSILSFSTEAIDTTVLTATHFYINFNVPVDSLPADIKIMAGNQQLFIEQAFDSTYVVAVTEEKGEYDITLTHKDTTLTLGKVRTAAFDEIAPVDIGYVAVNDTMYAGAFNGTAIQFSPNTFSFKNDTLDGAATFYENGLPEILTIDTSSFYLTNYTDSTVDIYNTKQKFKYQTFYIKDFLALYGETGENGRMNNQEVLLRTRMAMLPFLISVAQLANLGVRLGGFSPYIYVPDSVPDYYRRFNTIVTDLNNWIRWGTFEVPGYISAALIWAVQHFNKVTGANRVSYPNTACLKCMYGAITAITGELYNFHLNRIKSAKEQAQENTPAQFEVLIQFTLLPPLNAYIHLWRGVDFDIYLSSFKEDYDVHNPTKFLKHYYGLKNLSKIKENIVFGYTLQEYYELQQFYIPIEVWRKGKKIRRLVPVNFTQHGKKPLIEVYRDGSFQWLE